MKQTCISEVSFASLVAMPESESSLPKLSFPKENPRKKEKVCTYTLETGHVTGWGGADPQKCY